MASRSEKSDPGRELARISHELSATAPDPSASATARSQALSWRRCVAARSSRRIKRGLLDVPSKRTLVRQ